MKVQLLEIQPRNKTNCYDVSVLVGKNRHIFPVKIQETKIDESVIQVAGSGRYRWETLQYNAGVISQIDRLVLKIYNGQDLSLPITITEHLPKSPILQKNALPNDPIPEPMVRLEIPVSVFERLAVKEKLAAYIQ